MKALIVVIPAGSGVLNSPASLLGINAGLLFVLIDGISHRALVYNSMGLCPVVVPRTD